MLHNIPLETMQFVVGGGGSAGVVMTSNPNAQAKGKKPLFVQFVLETLHNVYNTVLSGDKEKTEKVASVLNMKILPRDMKVRLLHAFVMAANSVPIESVALWKRTGYMGMIGCFANRYWLSIAQSRRGNTLPRSGARWLLTHCCRLCTRRVFGLCFKRYSGNGSRCPQQCWVCKLPAYRLQSLRRAFLTRRCLF
jgi:hypothetical protein